MPCPSSALPVKMVPLPAASMRIHASSIGSVPSDPGSFGVVAASALCTSPCCATPARDREKLTSKAPAPVRTRRRLCTAFCIGLDLRSGLFGIFSHQIGGTADGLEDAHM